MTGLKIGTRTEDGRLISPHGEYTEAEPIVGAVAFYVELGRDLVANDSRFPPPMPKEDAA